MSLGVAPAHNPQYCRTLAFNGRSQSVPPPSCFNTTMTNKLHIYVQLDRVTAQMGMGATGWENRTFLDRGELRHNQHAMVEFFDTYWNLTATVNTSDNGTIDKVLNSDTDSQVRTPLSPVTLALFNALSAPPLQYRPPTYCTGNSSCADHSRWTCGSCDSLINYLCLALIIVNDTESPSAIVPNISPFADNFLLDRCQFIFEQDFPLSSLPWPVFIIIKSPMNTGQSSNYTKTERRNSTDCTASYRVYYWLNPAQNTLVLSKNNRLALEKCS